MNWIQDMNKCTGPAAEAGDAPLCDQMLELQARAAKLRPIDLQDAELDAGDPYTRLFLLAEYWQRKCKEAQGQRGTYRVLLREADEVLSTVEPDDTHEAALLDQLRTDIARAMSAQAA